MIAHANEEKVEIRTRYCYLNSLDDSPTGRFIRHWADDVNLSEELKSEINKCSLRAGRLPPFFEINREFSDF